MSTQTLDHIPDLELDIDWDAELEDDEHSHAIPFCYLHKSPEWFPVSGSIVQVLCGRLIRIKNVLTDLTKKKCDECVNFRGKTNCYVCGIEVYG